MIITLIAGIVVAALLAIAIMKFIPLKLQWLVSIVLISVAGYLGYAIYDSIMAPIRFNSEKKIRYAKVISNLRMIRDAQDAHKTITGRYERDGAKLIEFIDSAEFAITNTHNEIKQVNKGTKWQPIMVEIEEKDRVRNMQPPISGEEIMEIFNLQPCRTVGDIKTAIKDAILDGQISNSYDDAYAFMVEFAAGLNIKPVKK